MALSYTFSKVLDNTEDFFVSLKALIPTLSNVMTDTDAKTITVKFSASLTQVQIDQIVDFVKTYTYVPVEGTLDPDAISVGDVSLNYVRTTNGMISGYLDIGERVDQPDPHDGATRLYTDSTTGLLHALHVDASGNSITRVLNPKYRNQSLAVTKKNYRPLSTDWFTVLSFVYSLEDYVLDTVQLLAHMEPARTDDPLDPGFVFEARVVDVAHNVVLGSKTIANGSNPYESYMIAINSQLLQACTAEIQLRKAGTMGSKIVLHGCNLIFG